MFNRYKFSEARQRFTHLIDEVQQSKLQVIKKRKQNEKDAILLDIETQKFLLKPFGFNLEVLTEENNSTTLAINELDVFVNSASFDEALSELIDELILYGEESAAL